jgi:hypothetical protein
MPKPYRKIPPMMGESIPENAVEILYSLKAFAMRLMARSPALSSTTCTMCLWKENADFKSTTSRSVLERVRARARLGFVGCAARAADDRATGGAPWARSGGGLVFICVHRLASRSHKINTSLDLSNESQNIGCMEKVRMRVYSRGIKEETWLGKPESR